MMFAKLAKGTVNFSSSHSKLILGIAVFLLIPGGFVLKSLRVESQLLDADSFKDPAFQIYKDNFDRFGDSTPVVLLQKHEGVSEEIKNKFTDLLVEKLGTLAEISSVDAGLLTRGRSYQKESSRMIAAAVINGRPEYRELLLKKLSLDGIEREILRTRKSLIVVPDPALRELIALDVLNLREIFKPWFDEFMGNFSVSEEDPYFSSKDHTARLIFLQAGGSGEDMDYCLNLTAEIENIIADVKSSIPGAENITCSFAGKYGLTAESATFMNREILVINTVSAILIFLLLILIFRNLKVTVICLFPILYSVFLTLLVVRFLFNPLTLISVGFIAVLIGMGIDITFHLSSRFFQHYKALRSKEKALESTMSECGPPVFIGILTTAGAFAVLIFSSYSAIKQFGIITCSGLLITLLATFFLFPAVISIIKINETTNLKLSQIGAIPGFVYKNALKKPVASHLIAVVIILFSLTAAARLNFDMRLFELLPQKMKTLQNAKEVARLFGTSFLVNTQITIEAQDLTRALAFQKILDQKIKSLAAAERISGFYSPSLFFIHKDSKESVQFFKTAQEKIRQNRERFFELLENYGFQDSPAYSHYYETLEMAFEDEFVTQTNFQNDELLRKFLKFENETYFLQTYIWPKDEIKSTELLLGISKELEKIIPPDGVSMNLTGTYQVYHTVKSILKSEFLSLSLWAGGIVLLILLLFFRKIRNVILSLVPLFGAIPVTLAFIVILNLSFSPAIICIIALIIGIGIDDAVHLVYRKSLNKERSIEQILKEIAPVLTLTTVSTSMGFLVLNISSSPLLSAVGSIIGFGVILSWIFSMFWLPLFLKTWKTERMRGRDGSEC